MTVTIELRQTREVISEEVWSVSSEVTRAVNIIPEVFVQSTATQAYLRVAMVDDIVSLPRTLADAQEQQSPTYLTSSTVFDSENMADAKSFAAYVQDRIRHLCVTYADYSNNFEGTSEYTLSSDD